MFCNYPRRSARINGMDFDDPTLFSSLTGASALTGMERLRGQSLSADQSRGRAPSGGFILPEDLLSPRQKATRFYKGGQFIPLDAWRFERAKAYQHLPVLIAETNHSLSILLAACQQSRAVLAIRSSHPELLAAFPASALEPAQVQAEIMHVITQGYAQAMTLGRRAGGNLTSPGPAEEARVKSLVSRQAFYMNRFLSDIATGSGVMGYEKRMEFYGRATKEAFWSGYLTASLDKKRTVTWHTGATHEKCETCLAMVAKGPIPIAEFIEQYAGKGIIPGSGELACKGFHCDCYLTED